MNNFVPGAAGAALAEAGPLQAGRKPDAAFRGDGRQTAWLTDSGVKHAQQHDGPLFGDL